jgi:hypothetical protein
MGQIQKSSEPFFICTTFLSKPHFLSEPEFTELQNCLRDVDQNKNFKELENWPAFAVMNASCSS